MTLENEVDLAVLTDGCACDLTVAESIGECPVVFIVVQRLECPLRAGIVDRRDVAVKPEDGGGHVARSRNNVDHLAISAEIASAGDLLPGGRPDVAQRNEREIPIGVVESSSV